jgi:predicted nucleotidyltransferase
LGGTTISIRRDLQERRPWHLIERQAKRREREARPVFERYGIEKAILFGSLAAGRQSARSDVDLILVQRTCKPYFERFEGILRDLYRAIPGRDIECFIYSPEELAGISHRAFVRKALREGIVIYEH